MPKINRTRIYQVQGCEHCVCNVCGRNFNTLKLLKLHKRVKHTNSTPFHCPHCDGTFSDTREMKKHLTKYYHMLKK